MKRKRNRYYDPSPRKSRRSRKGHEPAGLRRYRLAKKRLDPGYPSSYWKGPRGGHYFRGPHKNRYDPAAKRRVSRLRDYGRRAGSKIETIINKYGSILGGLVGLGAGIYTGYNEYQKAYGPSAGKNYLATITGGDIFDANGVKIGTRTPEISKLWGTNDSTWGGGVDLYLKYKFLGLDANNKYVGSAWSIPFIGGLVATLAAPIARLFTHKFDRILKPVSKIGKGVLAVSTIGALALPGSNYSQISPPRIVNMLRTPNGFYGQTPTPIIKIGGAF